METQVRALPVLKTRRLSIRLGADPDVPAILDYFARNQEFFAATDPRHPPKFYTSGFWRDQLTRSVQEFFRDQSVRLFLFSSEGASGEGASGPERVIGAVNFAHIVRGAFHACYLGYGLDEKAQGQGLMSEALRVAIAYVFEQLNLHRIMANYLPNNERSAAVLKRLGFVIEGRARDYLFVGGQWSDHVLTSLGNPAWRDLSSPR